jgi:hypothetical protein
VHGGGAHVREQIESLRAQSDPGWRLIVRDDGSTDESAALLEACARDDARIEIVREPVGRLGTRASYSLLLALARERGADWVALCDQDDVWLPDKLARQRALAERLGADPADAWLLHSDLAVTDAGLAPVHGSLMGFMGLRHQDEGALGTLLVQNFVTGCSAMVSRGLLGFALPIPDQAIVHDWWLALSAAACGRIAFDAAPTVLYRQHADNQIGARGYRESIRRLLGRTLALRRHSPDELLATIDQAAALRERLVGHRVGGHDSPALRDALRVLDAYLPLFAPGVGRLRRVRGLRGLGVGRQDRLRRWALELKLLTTPVTTPVEMDAHRGRVPGAASAGAARRSPASLPSAQPASPPRAGDAIR